MGKLMQYPHILVIEDVYKRWLGYQSRGLLQKIIRLGQIKPQAIDIYLKECYDKRRGDCTGKVIKRWRFDNRGLCLLSEEDGVVEEKVVEMCSYCIDIQLKQLLVVWTNILSSASSRKNIYHFQDSTLYEMFENDGFADFKIIETWIE